jgi:ribose 5-phosphate isomerase
MIFTAEQIANAIGADWLVLSETRGVVTVVEAVGLPIDIAQSKVDRIIATGSLDLRVNEVSPAQMRVWLVLHGVTMAMVDAFIDAIPDETQRELAKIAWEYGLVVRRSDPMVSAFAMQLQMTEQQMDQAFEDASKLLT